MNRADQNYTVNISTYVFFFTSKFGFIRFCTPRRKKAGKYARRFETDIDMVLNRETKGKPTQNIVRYKLSEFHETGNDGVDYQFFGKCSCIDVL